MEPAGRRNRAVAEAARLHRPRHRKSEGLTLIEGPNLISEARAAGVTVVTLFTLAGGWGDGEPNASTAMRTVVVDEEALRRLAGTTTPRGPVAVIETPGPDPLHPSPTLVSWGVSDPGNVGTMIRIAAGFGWGFAYLDGSADPWSPKVLRSGAGAHFRTALSVISGPEDLRSAGLELVAAVVAGGVEPAALKPGPFAVLIGEEAAGLPEAVASLSDYQVSIPMRGGIDSLNAAVAAGILVYELSKQGGEISRQG